MVLAASSFYSNGQTGFATSVEASGEVGSVTGSIGQVAYISHANTYSITQGVQQPYQLPQVGCLEPSYIEGMPYSAGDIIQQEDKLYQCKVAGWCSGAAWAYAPESGAHWQLAWDFVDFCNGSASAPEPNGCTEPIYVEGNTYLTGATVQNNDKIYTCKVGGWCSNAAWAYEPGNGAHWDMAWTYLNDCGTQSNSGTTQRSASLTEEAATAVFMLYPNPANDLVYLTFNSALATDQVALTVTNQMGQLVLQDTYQVNAINDVYQIATGQLEEGAYLVAITSEQQSSVQKLVIVR